MNSPSDRGNKCRPPIANTSGNAWVDFKALRAKLDFEQVLRLYGVEVKRKGEQHHGFCPLPNHQGKRNSPSFSANLEKGIFQCFGCGAKGNVIEFAALMENVDVASGQAFRALAVRLREKFCPEAEKPEAPARVGNQPTTAKPTPHAVLVNVPLDFELKGLDHTHPYLSKRGFSADTIREFGLGFCSRGLLTDRIAIPLEDHKGRLIGYAGRVVNDASITENNPRYRFPSKRERQGRVLEFRKSRFLYNGFRVAAPAENLIVVEGFTSVWWLHQLGHKNVVATMGADCSERQAELILTLVSPAGHVWLMPDGDEAGERFAHSLLRQISPQRFVRWVRLDPSRQPTDLSSEELSALFLV